MTKISLTSGKRVLFLTKDPELIKRQLNGQLDLQMKDIKPDDLLDDINTDAMTPAWVCFKYKPEEIAENAYAGLIVNGERVFPKFALMKGNFEVIVSGLRKGVGSSRETAVQAEKYSGIKLAIAASFAPIHARNNINSGVLMGGYELLMRLQEGEEIPLSEFTQGYDQISKLIVESGGLFSFNQALNENRIQLPFSDTSVRPMTMTEKILANHLPGNEQAYVKPGDSLMLKVDGGYSHEFTTAQVHYFLESEYGENYTVPNPQKFAVFEDHLIYADGVAKMAPFSADIETLRAMQRLFQKHTHVRDYNAKDGKSPGICHQVAREEFIDPGDFILATDSHTCMGGASNALAYGVGSTEYAALIYSGLTPVQVPESIRFELQGQLQDNVTAKDVMLFILNTFAKEQKTLNRSIEIGGEGLATLDCDERATMANMATECSARCSVIEADDLMLEWIAKRRSDTRIEDLRKRVVRPDKDAHYHGGIHMIDLAGIKPMVATPGDPERGIPSDPTNGALISDLGDIKIDIAYGGSCTAGKITDIELYARVLREAASAGLKVAEHVQFYLQFGSQRVEEYARKSGLLDIFTATNVQVISPGCGACIGCGPGVSTSSNQTTVSAINRNYRGRSGPGELYLASPLTVAASAILGKISAFKSGMFH